MYHGEKRQSQFAAVVFMFCNTWGIPYKEMARRLDIPYGTFLNMMSGKTSTAKQRYVDDFVELCPWSVDWLYGTEVYRDPCKPIKHSVEV